MYRLKGGVDGYEDSAVEVVFLLRTKEIDEGNMRKGHSI